MVKCKEEVKTSQVDPLLCLLEKGCTRVLLSRRRLLTSVIGSCLPLWNFSSFPLYSEQYVHVTFTQIPVPLTWAHRSFLVCKAGVRLQYPPSENENIHSAHALTDCKS